MLLEQIILILDSRGLESPQYKNIMRQNANIQIIIADNLETANEIIEKYESDLILIYDNFNKNIKKVCAEIRKKDNLYRPILVVLSDEEKIEKKLEIIKAGADDLQNISANEEEISLRIFAHLRRNIEELSDSVTKLPISNTVYKILKRNIEVSNHEKENYLSIDKNNQNQNKNEYIAVMYLDIDNYIPYKEIYGYIAAEKLIQTFVAIIKTSINKEDFLGQIGENGFVILTNPEKAEKIATFLSYSFDSVAPKFYSQEDAEKGYILQAGDNKAGLRMPIVSLSIGIASNQYNSFRNYQEALNLSRNMQRLAKSKAGSYWVSDRPKISNGDIIEKIENRILIFEKDAALAYLLATTLAMQGYRVETVNNPDEIINYLKKNETDLVLIDMSNIQQEEQHGKELEICKIIKQKYPEIKVIVSTVNRNKEKIFDFGADLYIPKPYELMTLFSWIERFLNDKL